jgi:hypothetical protein
MNAQKIIVVNVSPNLKRVTGKIKKKNGRIKVVD